MFGKLKEKLTRWFKSSEEKIEETAEVVKTTEESNEPAEEEIEKAEKLIEETKKQPPDKTPSKFNIATRKFEPDTEEIKEEAEAIKKELDKIKKQEKETKRFEKTIEKIPQKTPRTVEEAKEEIKETQKIAEEIEESTKEEKGGGYESQKPKKSFFQRVTSTFSYKISEDGFNEIFDDLELLLLENNVALEVVEDIRSKLAEKLIGKEIKQQELENEIKQELKNTLNEILIEPDNPLEIIKTSKKPFIILFFGINGTGKTTSLSKVAYFLKQAGLSVVLAAADTFRAASIEQLSEHASKLKVPIIKHNYNSDPAAVGFDAIKYAKAHKTDVVLIDTAGRMHTKTNLIEEMKKIERVTSPDLKIFVAESIAGNDATEQAKTFNKAIEIDGTILSKADIDEKGGTIISISHATNKPIFFLGTGQNYEDLQLFNKQKFIESLGL